MKTETLFSSKTDEWATPQDFFDRLNEEFHFTLDPCATADNRKCDTYFTKEQNGLLQNWGGAYRILQPAIRQRDRKMVRKGVHGKQEARDGRRSARSCQNGHKMVS